MSTHRWTCLVTHTNCKRLVNFLILLNKWRQRRRQDPNLFPWSSLTFSNLHKHPTATTFVYQYHQTTATTPDSKPYFATVAQDLFIDNLMVTRTNALNICRRKLVQKQDIPKAQVCWGAWNQKWSIAGIFRAALQAEQCIAILNQTAKFMRCEVVVTKKLPYVQPCTENIWEG